MQLADRELSDEERAELEAAVAADPDAAAKLEALGHLRDAVRGHLELAADDAEPRLARMWGEIDKQIGLAAEAAAAPVTTAAPAAPATPAPSTERTDPAPGLWGRFTRWLDAHRGHVLTGALSAGAVAAITLVLRPAPSVTPPTGPTAGAPPIAQRDPGPGPTEGTGPIEAQPAAQPTPPEIESMEVTGGSGTVFTIEGDDGEQTTVIWVTPDDTLEGI